MLLSLALLPMRGGGAVRPLPWFLPFTQNIFRQPISDFFTRLKLFVADANIKKDMKFYIIQSTLKYGYENQGKKGK